MRDHLKPVVLNLALILCAAALLFRAGSSPIHASDDKVTKWNAAGLIIVNQTKKKVYDLHLILEYGESDAPTIAKVTVEKAAAYNAQSDAYQDPTGAKGEQWNTPTDSKGNPVQGSSADISSKTGLAAGACIKIWFHWAPPDPETVYVHYYWTNADHTPLGEIEDPKQTGKKIPKE